jgi:hypothetical protein
MAQMLEVSAQILLSFRTFLPATQGAMMQDGRGDRDGFVRPSLSPHTCP